MMIIGAELIRQSDAPVRPVLIQLPATLETERADPSVTQDVGMQKRSDSERSDRFSAGLLCQCSIVATLPNMPRMLDTERPSSDTPRQ